MHKGIMILVKTEQKDIALIKTREFLDEYKTVWDWFVIGGRWSNTLAPIKEFKQFEEIAKKILEVNEEDFGISTSKIKEHAGELQDEWEKLGLKGNSPYFDHYQLKEDGDDYDVIPLKDCLEKVKEWAQTLDNAKAAEKEATDRWLQQEGKDGIIRDDWNMYGYQLKIAGELYQQEFCFETNVYNTENYNYSIPEDIENYYVVMVDIHN